MKKPWGESIRILSTDTVQVERIRILPGGYSSIHRHHDKVNLFVVLSGRLQVRLYDDRMADRVASWMEPQSVHYVEPGDSIEIMPTALHQFYADSWVDAFEVYYAVGLSKIRPNDIVRFSENGVAGLDVPPRTTFCCQCNKTMEGENKNVVVCDGAIREMCLACVSKTDHSVLATANMMRRL